MVAIPHQPQNDAEEDTKSANTTTKQAAATEDVDLDTPIDLSEAILIRKRRAGTEAGGKKAPGGPEKQKKSAKGVDQSEGNKTGFALNREAAQFAAESS